jgi:4-hydroxy-tetrahydrodipicolinate synthase
MSEPLRGAFAPVPTPVGSDGRLDLDALGRHLEWLASSGLDGALILGTNGEFPSFTLAEREQVAAAAAEASQGLELLLGVGSCALAEVLTMLEVAARHGFAGALCPPPFYFRRPPAAGLAAFFEAVLEAARVPVLLYHIPQVTGVPIDDGLLDRIDGMDRHGALGGVKDSSGVPDELARLSRRFCDRSYIVGNDTLISSCRQAGGTGSITAVASIAPGLVQQAWTDPEAQARLDRVRRIIESYGLGPAVKAVLRHRGLGEYGTRPPLAGLDPDLVPRLLAELRDEGVEGGRG